MKKLLLRNKIISLLIVVSMMLVKCDKENVDDTTFTFPLIENIDSQVYDEIKKTCKTYWDLNKMTDTTFEIISVHP